MPFHISKIGLLRRARACLVLSLIHERHVLPAQDTTGKRYAKPDTEDEEEKRRAADPNDERAGRTDRLEQQNRDHKKDGGANKVAQRLQRQRVQKEKNKPAAARAKPREAGQETSGSASERAQSHRPQAASTIPVQKGEKRGAEAEPCLSRQASGEDAGSNSEPGDDQSRNSRNHDRRHRASVSLLKNSMCRLLKKDSEARRVCARSRFENGGSRIAIFYPLSSILDSMVFFNSCYLIKPISVRICRVFWVSSSR